MTSAERQKRYRAKQKEIDPEGYKQKKKKDNKTQYEKKKKQPNKKTATSNGWNNSLLQEESINKSY